MNPSMNTAVKGSNSDHLVDDLKKVVDDANGLIKEAGSYSVGRLSAARTQVEEKFRHVRSRVDEMRRSTADKTKHAADVTHQYVVDNPWKSLGIMAAATAVIAYLITRR